MMRLEYDKLKSFYDRPVHLQRKWYSYINQQKTESKLVNNMRKKFGKDFVFVMGDYSDAGHTMKYQMPTKTTGFLKLFRKNGIPTFLLDEHKTSSVCPRCDGKVEKNFKSRLSSRPWRRAQGHTEKVHGLLGCTNPICKRSWTMYYWNRDLMSTCNMLRIVHSVISTGRRPCSLDRTKESDTVDAAVEPLV